MTGVIGLMKPSLESQRMYSSRVLLGSVAASTATFCVLSLSSAAMGSSDGFIDVSNTQVRCCYIIEDGRITNDSARRVIDPNTGGLVGNPGTTKPIQNDHKFVGAALAADQIPVVPDTTTGNNLDKPVINDDTGTGADKDATPEKPDTDEFTGSPEPVGPDLDSSAERDLISSGWK